MVPEPGVETTPSGLELLAGGGELGSARVWLLNSPITFFSCPTASCWDLLSVDPIQQPSHRAGGGEAGEAFQPVFSPVQCLPALAPCSFRVEDGQAQHAVCSILSDWIPVSQNEMHPSDTSVWSHCSFCSFARTSLTLKEPSPGPLLMDLHIMTIKYPRRSERSKEKSPGVTLQVSSIIL